MVKYKFISLEPDFPNVLTDALNSQLEQIDGLAKEVIGVLEDTSRSPSNVLILIKVTT